MNRVPWIDFLTSTVRSKRRGLQLHWGGAYREGQLPCVPAGPTFTSSAEHSWESGDSCTVTPLSLEPVQTLDIGGGSNWGASKASRLALELQYSSQGLLSSEAVGNEGLARAAAVAAVAAAAQPRADGKRAWCAVLQLPMDGVFRYVPDSHGSTHPVVPFDDGNKKLPGLQSWRPVVCLQGQPGASVEEHCNRDSILLY